MTMITTILAVLLVCVWCIGGILASFFMGLEINKVSDLLKIMFWPITVFLKK
jgi:hypothetical protein